MPKSAMDLLKPELRGKVITSYPNDDDVTAYLFYTIMHKYGWNFVDRYTVASPRWVRRHLTVARTVASGRAALAFLTMANGLPSLMKDTVSLSISLFRLLTHFRSGRGDF